MWNRENAARLISLVTKEYSREIIAEGSKSVLGLEDHLDKLVAKILGTECEIVTAAREWRKVIERAAITEGIDKVQLLIEGKNNHANHKISIIEEPEIKLENELAKQIVQNKEDSNEEELDMIVEENHITENKEYKEEARLMEDIKAIQEEESKSLNSNQQCISIKETEEEIMLIEESDLSLNKSIWAPSKDRRESKGNIKAKVAAIKVLEDNAKH